MSEVSIDEVLARRRLHVMNVPEVPAPPATPDAPAPGAYVLEGDGAAPGETPRNPDAVREDVIDALRLVKDPEIPVNIYDLGLIYELDVAETGHVSVKMTLTAPGCPVAGSLVGEVQQRMEKVPGVRHARTELVWDPPWTQDRLSEAAKLELGLY